MKFNFGKGFEKIGEDIKKGINSAKEYQAKSGEREEARIEALEKKAALAEREAAAKQRLSAAHAATPKKDEFGFSDMPIFKKKGGIL